MGKNTTTMGTGIGQHQIMVLGVPCTPYGEKVSVWREDMHLMGDGWTVKGPTNHPASVWAIPPAYAYRCVKHSSGSPEYDGSQTIEYTS